ncbi:MAG TPA: hypothetical protein VFV86_07495 [Nitrososphaeraceae archaeon]|nr:hypothetical protein [Nitrososphaeraceae archaeon]
MDKQIINCKRCGGNACIEYKEKNISIWHCMGCGFFSTSVMKNKYYKDYLKTLPELHKDLKFKDKDGFYWFPMVYNEPTKGLLFADGTSKKDWKWSAILAVELQENEKQKFPEGTTHKMDMSTLKQFEEKDYIEALDFLGYFV